MSKHYFILAGLALMSFIACGSSDDNNSDGGVGNEASVSTDGGSSDFKIVVPEAGEEGGTAADKGVSKCDINIIGKNCTGPEQCGGENSGHICLLTYKDDKGVSKGICTCECSLDNPSTTYANEDTCPGSDDGQGQDPKSTCGTVTYESGKTANLCFKRCVPKHNANECDGELACNPFAPRYVNIDVPPFLPNPKSVCFATKCQKNEDCPALTDKMCYMNQPNNCPTGEKCYDVLVEGKVGFCAKPGVCDTVSGLCDGQAPDTFKADAEVGDPCKSDQECGQYMRCRWETNLAQIAKKDGEACTTDDDCCSNYCDLTAKKCKGKCLVLNRNGYCIGQNCMYPQLTHFKCGLEAACNKLWVGGLCMKKCTVGDATTCRGQDSIDKKGDYDCRAWNELQSQGISLFVDSPICDFGPGIPCSAFKGSSWSCATLGGQGNPTQMKCKGMDGSDMASDSDEGYCFDNTSCSDKPRIFTDAGPLPIPDAGVTPDQGVTSDQGVTPDAQPGDAASKE